MRYSMRIIQSVAILLSFGCTVGGKPPTAAPIITMSPTFPSGSTAIEPGLSQPYAFGSFFGVRDIRAALEPLKSELTLTGDTTGSVPLDVVTEIDDSGASYSVSVNLRAPLKDDWYTVAVGPSVSSVITDTTDGVATDPKVGITWRFATGSHPRLLKFGQCTLASGPRYIMLIFSEAVSIEGRPLGDVLSATESRSQRSLSCQPMKFEGRTASDPASAPLLGWELDCGELSEGDELVITLRGVQSVSGVPLEMEGASLSYRVGATPPSVDGCSWVRP